MNWPEDVPSADADLTKEQWRDFYLRAQEQLDYIAQMLFLPPGNIGDEAVKEYTYVIKRLEQCEVKTNDSILSREMGISQRLGRGSHFQNRRRKDCSEKILVYERDEAN